jgi:phosphoribosylanthranilate isomerase
MSKLIIKASEITNLTDARYFSAWAADYLGFNLVEGTDSFIEPIQLNAIKEWLSGPKIIAELGSMADVETIKFCLETLKLDGIQIGHFTPIENLEAISAETKIIVEIGLENLDELSTVEGIMKDWSSITNLFFLNLEKNHFSWNDFSSNETYIDALKSICSKNNLILALEFEPEQLKEILEKTDLHGIGLKGGSEEKTGIKSFEDLDLILENLEELQ